MVARDASRRRNRIAAFQALYAWDITCAPVVELVSFPWIDGAVPKVEEADADKPASSGMRKPASALDFARLLLCGTVENCREIDKVIKPCLENWDWKRVSRVDRAVLRMSVFSLLYQKDVPVSVVIDEAVEIAKSFGEDNSFRFVNGILDAVGKSLK
jgi:N utilization substance protein B